MGKLRVAWVVLGAAAVLAGGVGRGGAGEWAPRAANLVVPQSRVFWHGAARPANQSVQITGIDASVSILERAATTVLEIGLSNPADVQQQAELLVPVPEGAALRGFTFQGSGAEPTAELLRREEARRIYDGIVSRLRDPALLEFAGMNLVRSSVFPVPARGTQKLRLTYEQVLAADGNRVDYVLPRSENLDYRVPWTVSVRVRDTRTISTAYSPSHGIETRRAGPHDVSARLAEGAGTEPGPFRMSYLLEAGDSDEATASLLAYPDPRVGGGYFLLLAGLPAGKPDKSGSSGAPAIRREVTLVLDRSGSMAGGKLEQARAAAMQVIAGLDPGEFFNVIAYNEGVDPLWSRPMAKDEAAVGGARGFLDGLTARGGTNIHDALLEALRPQPAEGVLPIVLFLTDGRPTVGQTGEKAIRELAVRHNPHGRRIFTFGVGLDVNTPLLERLAGESRAACAFVLPGEDIEVKVSGVFGRLAGPALADPRLEVLGADGQPAAGRVRELEPGRLPDLFAGDHLVLLGRYVGEAPLEFRLSGNCRGRRREFAFKFGLEKASARHGFVPRLWATRRIAVLAGAVRDLGAEPGAAAAGAGAAPDPRLKELVEEIVRLATEFGVLTEYTSFLAREGTDLARRDAVMAQSVRNFQERAVHVRGGLGSVSQDMNLQAQRGQAVLNMRNVFLDENLKRVEVSGVQQRGDRAYYRQNGRWVDGRLLAKGGAPEPARVVEMGSAEHRELVGRLAEQGRAGAAAFSGETLIEVDGQAVLVK